MLRIENPRWYLQTLPVRCEAAHPGTMICSNRLPLMDVDALRTGLHAAAPMRPANSHVKVSVRHGAKYSNRNYTGERLRRINARELHEQMNLCSCLTLILACVIYWQAKEISRVVRWCQPEDDKLDVALLEHVSPIEWDNVILYGQYVLDRAQVC